MEASQSQYPGEPSKEPIIKRYKPIWRVALIANFVLGAYIFAEARKKNMNTKERKPARRKVEENKASLEPSPVPDAPPPLVVKIREPIPEDQQRQLFQWILEEKRKVRPTDLEDKKRIDEEKAILKRFIRAKSIPTF